jgi:type IV secretion system protein VirB10
LSDNNNQPVIGERHVSEVAAPPRINNRHGALMIGIAGLCVAGYFAFHGGATPKKTAEKDGTQQISQVSQFEPPKAVPASIQQPMPPPPPQAEPPPRTLIQRAIGQVDDPLKKAREASLLGRDNQAQQGVQPASATTEERGPGAAQPESELAGKLHATILEGSKAAVLPHPEMTVTMGTLIPCVLQTAMDSSAPGIVTCVTQQDVFGTTGSVVLMERGTKIVGEYSSAMHQGQNRMFVLWNRAETPAHVVITLGSPGADVLGRAGFDGQIDNHFWDRFGGALMLTFIDGAFSAVSNLASQHGGTSLNFGTGESAATEALRNSINIPPTIRKNQGELVSVMAARDLDFSGVYNLSLRAAR